MRSRQVFPTILALLPLLTGGLCHGQSLGELARQARQQKEKNGTTAKKVYATDDLTASSDSSIAAVSSSASKNDPVPYTIEGSAGFTMWTWIKTIKAQKEWIAQLQQVADKLNEAPQFDPSKVSTPEAKRQWEERSKQEHLAAQIPEQKKKLALMQADAKKAGMAPWIVDPQ